jgi:hypothetical protein
MGASILDSDPDNQLPAYVNIFCPRFEIWARMYVVNEPEIQSIRNKDQT